MWEADYTHHVKHYAGLKVEIIFSPVVLFVTMHILCFSIDFKTVGCLKSQLIIFDTY